MHRPRVLIVEDNRDGLATLLRLMPQDGFRAFGAATALEAITHLNSGVEPPDSVLVDLEMGEPPGEAIIRLIRDMGLRSYRTGLPTRVVAYTGFDPGAPSVRAAMAAGADAVLIKPCVIGRIVAVLRGEDPGDTVDLPGGQP